jgi:hypothetical protein
VPEISLKLSRDDGLLQERALHMGYALHEDQDNETSLKGHSPGKLIPNWKSFRQNPILYNTNIIKAVFR